MRWLFLCFVQLYDLKISTWPETLAGATGQAVMLHRRMTMDMEYIGEKVENYPRSLTINKSMMSSYK